MKGLSSYTSIVKANKGGFLKVLAMGFLAGIFEAFGIALLLPILSSYSQLTKFYIVLFLLLLSLCAGAVFKYLTEQFASRLGVSIENSLRLEISRALATSDWLRVSKLQQGELTSAVLSESSQISAGVVGLAKAICAFSVVLILGFTAVATSPALSSIAGFFILAASLIFSKRVQRLKDNERALSNLSQEIGEEASSVLAELKYTRASGTEGPWLRRLEVAFDAYKMLRLMQVRIPTGTVMRVEIYGSTLITAVLGVSSVALGDPTLGLIFVTIFYRLVPRLQALQSSLGIAISQTAWVEKWDARMEALIPEARHIEAREFLEVPTSAKGPSIEVRELSFQHRGSAKPLIENLNMILPSGSWTAVTGQSGSGKSTLIDILSGLVRPSRGEVVFENARSIRPRIGMVPQDVPLRKGTIRENIAWGYEEHEDKIWQALGQADIKDFVKGLEHGLDTVLNSRHHGLSGGQRQRLGIARALYANPELLILDEATSALDSKTEDKVIKAIRTADLPQTVILVTHRKNILRYVDYHLDMTAYKGKESGSHSVKFCRSLHA